MLNTISHVYALNLERRPDRREHLLQELNRVNIEAEWIPAVDGNQITNITTLKPGEYGIILSYLRILKDAREKNYPAITILEDDSVFCEDFNQIIETYLDKLNYADYVNFGPNLFSKKFERLDDKFIKIYECYATQAILIKSNMYNSIIETLKKLWAPLDVMIANEVFPKFNIYGFNPAIIWQKNDFSDIQGVYADYNFHLIHYP